MGTGTSKEEDYSDSFQDAPTYQNVRRAYAKWDHHSGLASHDVSHFSTHEIRNLKRHHELSHNSPDQQKPISSNITKQSSLDQETQSTRKTHDDRSKYEKKLPLQESQSINQESYSKNVITAEQLLRTQSQRKQRHRPTPSSSSNDTLNNPTTLKPLTRTNANQFITSNNKIQQIPADLQLVLINQHDLQVKEK
jgi:hypothetical protein